MKMPGKNDKSKKKRSKRSDTVLVVAQEIKFARILAGNDDNKRAKILKTLKKWFSIRLENDTDFSQDDFMRIWKGIFYAMWMSDKPLVQEELCESIVGIMDLFPVNKVDYAMLFFYCGMKTLATEWYGIDQHRIDKFMMFARRFLRSALRCLQRDNWSVKSCQCFVNELSKKDGLLHTTAPTYARNALGLQMHLVDCYLEEIAKVSQGEIPDESFAELLKLMAQYMTLGKEARLSGWIKKHVFVQLLKQSPMGLEYDEKKRAWEKMGCPEGGVDALEVCEDSEDSDSEDQLNDNVEDDISESTALDPRAGLVDVVLPSLEVPAEKLIEVFEPLAVSKTATTQSRKRAAVCLEHMRSMQKGEFPLRAKEIDVAPLHSKKKSKTKVAHRMLDFEKKLAAESDELALRGLSRKKRKRVLSKVRSGEDVTAAKLDTAPSPTKKRKLEQNGKGIEKNQQASSQKKTKEKSPKASKKRSLDKVSPKASLEKSSSCVSLEEKEPKVTLKKGSPKLSQAKTLPVKVSLEKECPIESLEESPLEKSIKKIMSKKSLEKSTPKSSEKSSPRKSPIKKTIEKTSTKKPFEKSSINKKSFIKSSSNNYLEKSPPIQNGIKPTVLRGKSVKMETKSPAEVSIIDSTTPKKVTILLQNNTAQAAIDYVKSVKQSPNIPFDSSKKPVKTNLKPHCTPSPINPFYKKKLRLSASK